MRVLYAGDTHGNYVHIDYLYNQAKEFDVDIIFQLGDFGYWEHKQKGVSVVTHVESKTQTYGIPLYFLDGNHENHPLLWKTYQTENEEGFIVVRDGLFYSPRGHRWIWNDTRFLSIGGSFSIDRNYRRPGTSFWFEEEITEEDVHKAIQGGKVDVMLCHDVPAVVDINQIMFIQTGQTIRLIRESAIQRDRLQ